MNSMAIFGGTLTICFSLVVVCFTAKCLMTMLKPDDKKAEKESKE